MCTCVRIQVYLHTHEAAKVYTRLHMQHLTGSLGRKMERKEVFLTKDKVTGVSNKTAVTSALQGVMPMVPVTSQC